MNFESLVDYEKGYEGRNFTEVRETTLLSLDGYTFFKLYKTKLIPNEI